jgi:DNA-binding transcriptional ArsR family regulator
MPPVKDIDDPRYVKAMSHPLRIRIVAMLRERKATPAQLAEWLQSSLGNVAYHVRTLEQLGLIELVEKTQVRGAISHHYRATEHPIVTDEAWGNAPPIAKQAAVGSALEIIHEYALASSAAGGFDRPEAQLTRTDVRLDSAGWQQVSKAVGRLLDELQRIEAAAAKRLERHPHREEPTNASIVMLAFDAIRLTGDGAAAIERGSHGRLRERSAQP